MITDPVWSSDDAYQKFLGRIGMTHEEWQWKKGMFMSVGSSPQGGDTYGTNYVPPVTPQPYVQATPYTTPELSMGTSMGTPPVAPGAPMAGNSFRGVRNQRRRSMGL
jgi:hypothetical protein